MPDGKILDPSEVSDRCERLRERGAVIVFTNGVFDLLHPGHVRYLEQAKLLGTHLLVAINSDESVRKIKGEKRPVFPLDERLEVLSALESVSLVTWFHEETPAQIVRAVRPHILVKGGDWKLEEIVGRDFVESYGGTVRTIPFLAGYSTSAILDKIARL
jgi:rfaE bifunctional protein nucleotidyltransferase chain/domain